MLSIRPARIADLPRIMSVLEAARGIMRGSGNINQWVNGYPSEAVIRDDIAAGYGYVVCEPDAAAACETDDAAVCEPDATAACEPDAAAVCKADAAAACKANAAAACKAGDAVACKADAAAACKAGAIVAYLFLLPTFAINGGLQAFASSTRNYYAFEDSVFPALKDFDYLIFDTSPAFGDFEKGIANCADTIVPVLKLDQFSADGFQTLIENLITTTKEIRCKDLLEKISFVILNQQDKRMKFQSLFAENFMKNFDDTQFFTIPTDTSFVKAQILKNAISDKSITARKETTDAIGAIIKEMTK